MPTIVTHQDPKNVNTGIYVWALHSIFQSYHPTAILPRDWPADAYAGDTAWPASASFYLFGEAR